MINNIIPIAIVINNDYAMQASVVIASLISSKNTDTFYHVNIVADSIDENNSKKLLSMQTNNVKIDIIQLGTKYKDITNNTRWPNIIFYKFDVPFILNNYEKVILLDADTIVLKDLSELYNNKLQDNYAAVVPDITQVLKLDLIEELPNYFNIGMVLFNVKKIKEDFTLNDFINCYKANAFRFLSPEQDTLNYLFDKKIYHISPKFQYITLYENYLKHNFYNFYKQYKTRKISNDDIVILHFQQMRPWVYGNIPFGNLWRFYYRMSPYNEKLENKIYNPIFNLYRKIRYNYRYLIFRKKLFFNYKSRSEILQ